MWHIAIPIPSQLGTQDIEVEVSINGQRQALHYRVESFYWNEYAGLSRQSCRYWITLSNYDHNWTLYYIGLPTDKSIQITFVRKKKLSFSLAFLYSLLNL
jgi:hypothetical protein